ncbi:MAG: 30S ribosomal protein S20, partial [Clostridia bacterium]|nr:30S ribosomal protein S20 [Clostridia bacterium]
MANIKSAKKRILVNRTKALQNQMVKSQLKTVIKKFNAAVEAG